MLLLSEDVMKKIVDKKEVINIIENAYRDLFIAEYEMPDRITIDMGDSLLLYMPCIMEDFFSTKMLTSFPNNPSKGLPLLDGTLTLHDRRNGRVLSIMDANYLTALRTGAVGAVGVKYLSRESDKNLGILGAGRQGFYQAVMSAEIHDFQKIIFYDTRGVSDAYISALQAELSPKKIEIEIAASNVDLVKKSDVIITATTSLSPVLPDDEDLLRGKSYISIGAYTPAVREFPDALYKIVDEFYMEEEFSFIESGDLSYPLNSGLMKKEDFIYLSSIIGNPRDNSGKTLCFKSVGIGLFDLMVAKSIYKGAINSNEGVDFSF